MFKGNEFNRHTFGYFCLRVGGIVQGRHLDGAHFHLNYKIIGCRDLIRLVVCKCVNVCICVRDTGVSLCNREETLSDGMI